MKTTKVVLKSLVVLGAVFALALVVLNKNLLQLHLQLQKL